MAVIATLMCNLGKDMCTAKRKTEDAKSLAGHIRYFKKENILSGLKPWTLKMNILRKLKAPYRDFPEWPKE